MSKTLQNLSLCPSLRWTVHPESSRKKKRRSIKLQTVTNTTPQITHKALAGRVRWAFDVSGMLSVSANPRFVLLLMFVEREAV
jgi:hypothetical protein